MPISISRYLAFALGVLTPIAETIRRWSTWRDDPPALLDDYLLGAFLVFGAWRATRDFRRGQRYLAAAWAFMCGLAYYSFFNQLYRYRLGLPDPAPISSGWVTVIKGIGLGLGVLALVLSLWPIPPDKENQTDLENQ